MRQLQAEIPHIPIVGTVGDKGTERRYCALARQAIRLQVSLEARCPSLVGLRCTLTGQRHRCLFWDLDDPLWQRMAQDVELERR